MCGTSATTQKCQWSPGSQRTALLSLLLHLQRGSDTVNMWSSAQLTRPKRGAEPPAGAICIPDKAIHHPHCSAQFKLLLETASGSSEQFYIYKSVMRALESCLVALWSQT